MPKKNTPIDLLKVRDAVVAHWLRTGSGPDVTELVDALDVPVSRLSNALRASAYGGDGRLEESQVPGCNTRPGGSRGSRGTYPTTWTPSGEHLRALLRDEGRKLHAWKVHVSVVPMRHLVVGNPTKTYKVNAPTEAEAERRALELAAREYGPLHSNTSKRAEWLGPDSWRETEAADGAGI